MAKRVKGEEDDLEVASSKSLERTIGEELDTELL
jgi:hypothetical protein